MKITAEDLLPVPYVGELSSAHRQALADAFVCSTFEPGQVIFAENAAREGMYLVATGQLELTKSYDGVRRQVGICGPRRLLGPLLAFDSPVHSVNGIALKESRIATLTRDALNRLREQHPEFFADFVIACGKLMQHELLEKGRESLAPHSPLFAGVRHEHDSLGDVEVPQDALWGAQTQRAVGNFQISGMQLDDFPELIQAHAEIKRCCAEVNRDLGRLDEAICSAIVEACDELIEGRWRGHFVVDMIQGGAGTSTNMNANEVIANRALELMGKTRGDYDAVHPNNHVNMSQSTNDVYPSAIKLALLRLTGELVEEVTLLARSFAKKGKAFANVIKMGRTQMQDAVPMTLGQEFNAWATMLTESAERIESALVALRSLNLGGTAIGTGINTDPSYAPRTLDRLRQLTGLDVHLAEDLVEATQDTSGFVELAGIFKLLAVRLSKICNDLRLLSSGPRCGLNEINLPAMQPGSSIMPGKVNPVIPEVVNQVAFAVIGNDVSISLAAESGQLQLNVFEPLMALKLFSSIRMMRRAMETLRLRCIDGITANVERCRELVHGSVGIVTALSPVLGYEVSAELAQASLASGQPLRELVLERGLLTESQLDDLLSPEAMTRPRSLETE